MLVKVKRSDLINAWGVLESLKNQKMGIQTTYKIVKNRKLIEPEIEAIQEAIKPSEKFIEFEKKRVELCEKFCKKDSGGKAIVENNSYAFEDSELPKFQVELKNLQSEYQEEFDKRKMVEKDIENLTNEEIEVDVTKIAINDIPDDFLTISQFETLLTAKLIEE